MFILSMKRHWSILAIALVLGYLMILPFFYFQRALGEGYKGILNQIIDDELFYMARIREVMDGHSLLGNTYLWEHKNQLPQQLFLPEILLAQPLKLLELNMVEGRILYSFLLPAVAFLLTYLAFYLISPSRLWANIFAVFLFFGLYLFKFNRPVIPQFVFLFWLSQFILIWLLISRRPYKWLVILNAVNFGSLFYLYPFYWTFYLVFFVVLTTTYFFRDKFLAKQFLKILIGGLLIGSFYFYLTFLATQLPEYQETLTRLQLVFSRSPSEIKSVSLAIVVLLLIGVLCRLKAIRINKEILFFIAGAFSSILVTNQNIITGQKFEFGHYRMLAVFFLVFTLYYLSTPIKKVQFSTIWLGVILLIIGLFVFRGVNGHISRTLKISEQDIYAQKYKAVFDWLNENTQKDSVVYSNEEISRLVPVYTANNVFYSRPANLFIISDNEVEERFILNNYFEKFSRDFVIENERAIWGVRYIDRYSDATQANKWRELLGLGLKSEVRLPEEEINMVIFKARDIQKENLENRLKKYQIDYTIWDMEKNPNWQLNKQKFLEKVFEKDNFVIYENTNKRSD